MRSCDPTRTSPAVPLATLDRLVLDVVLGNRLALLADRALPGAERLPGAREPALVDHERRPVEGAFAATAAGVGPR
ncbi:hypothetical protein ACFU8I_28665 [Streptomyces sp. NPDC057540]|uniref:hypothetical protein n=1 Tax=Streptomyces sp. NPDC057540 TaxID=3346160 RepID=UPI0036A1F50C